MSIFVFGSNESGIHGAGAALFAIKYKGAKRGIGFGPQGESFAIPTKDWLVDTLPYEAVDAYVKRFMSYAIASSETFHLSRIGCGLAGMDEAKISKMFETAPPNVKLIDDVGKVLCMAKNWHANFTQFGPF